MAPSSQGSGATHYSGLSDEELVARLKDREGAALAALYDRVGNLVFSTALRVLADVGLAEDVTQEVFLRLWRQPYSYEPSRGRFLSWLLSVTRNRAVDELRSRGRRVSREAPLPDMLTADPLGSGDEDPVRAAQSAEERRAVLAALATLPPEQRAAIELAYFGGLTQQEIATELGQPLGTVKTRIRLGMQKLRGALARE